MLGDWCRINTKMHSIERSLSSNNNPPCFSYLNVYVTSSNRISLFLDIWQCCG